jgi:hypothetical protein
MTVENSGSIRADSAVGGDARALLARRDPNRGTLSVSQVMGKQSIAKKGQGRTIIASVILRRTIGACFRTSVS